MAFRYPKKERLKSQKTIERLFREGSSVTHRPLRLIYLDFKNPGANKIEAGVTVSSKVFKKAIHRNRVKRLMREGYRLNKSLVFNNLEGHYAFLFLYLGKDIPSFIEIDTAMKALLKKLIARKNNEEIST
jgi:ribonuclease P protein component